MRFVDTSAYGGTSFKVDIEDRSDLQLLLLIVKRGLNTLEPAPKAAQRLYDDLVRALQ